VTPRQVRVDVVGGDPLGRGDAPVLSWWLPEGASVQHGYRIRTSDGCDSGSVSSDVQTFVQVPGFDPCRRSTTVQVQVTTDLGESGWSEPVELVSGLVGESDWTALWVGPDDPDPGPPGGRPAYWLRTTFDATTTDRSWLHVTSLGLHEVWLNGKRVGDAELAPGYTQYRRRVQVLSYDVSGLVRDGGNVVAVLLADGWFRGRIGMPRAADQYGTELALRLQVQDDEDQVLAATDSSWQWSRSHILAADLIGGQREDRRLVDRAVHDAAADLHWAPVAIRQVDVALLAPVAPAVRRVEEIAPVAATPLDDGAVIVDLGQNVNGWLRLTDLGPEGTTLTLRHGEHLDADRNLTTTHLDVDVPIFPEPLPVGQVDEVTSAGVEGDVFEPRFTTHGFRYARVEGHPGLTADDVTGVVVHSDLRRTGWFSCSDERVNRLHDAAVWSLRGNVCSVPTDCPQRERAGWTGDWQIFAPTAAFLYDVLGFTRSWLRDVALDQREDGCVAGISPSSPVEGFDGPVGMLNGSAGWGDVVVSAPWELYQAYGDVSLLRESWVSATAWVDYAATMAAGGRHPERVRARPVAAHHEQYLWDTGFHWGEWLEPDADIGDFGAFVARDKSEVATAYLCRSARILARMGEVIGAAPEVVRHYDDLAEGARRAWQAEFVEGDGSLRTRTQASHVRALAFGLVDDDDRDRVAKDLVSLVADAGGHLATGFLSTGLLLPTLADEGHLDTAFELLMQDTEPSWLTMIDRGATTVWERWNGVDADGVAHESLNHYSKGAVVSFLHRHVAGLVPTSPGYRTFRVRPAPGGALTGADLRLDSPYGPILVEWRLLDGVLLLDLEVPPGTTAEVCLPDGTTATVGPGRHSWPDVGAS
jgi:alpha-L-rhamnosidase